MVDTMMFLKSQQIQTREAAISVAITDKMNIKQGFPVLICIKSLFY